MVGDRETLASARPGARLESIDFSGADLTSVGRQGLMWIDRCSFARADLRQATLGGWYFRFCDLTGANLRGASLRDAHFSACDLTGADLRGADLAGATFGSVGVGKGAKETRLDGVLVDPGVDLSEV